MIICKCTFCNKEFEAKSAKAKFCGNACKMKDKRMQDKQHEIAQKKIDNQLINLRVEQNVRDETDRIQANFNQRVEILMAAQSGKVYDLNEVIKRTNDYNLKLKNENKNVFEENLALKIKIDSLTFDNSILKEDLKDLQREFAYAKKEFEREKAAFEQFKEKNREDSKKEETKEFKFFGLKITELVLIGFLFGLLAVFFGYRKSDIKKATKNVSATDLRNMYNAAQNERRRA